MARHVGLTLELHLDLSQVSPEFGAFGVQEMLALFKYMDF